jgi:predicted MPP superfamily phosphohydrolase
MRRFLTGLWAFTALVHLVFLAATSELLDRLGAPYPSAIALAVTIALVALLRHRLDLLAHDRPISTARRTLELLYFTHWCGAVGSAFLYLAGGALVLLATLLGTWTGEGPPLSHGSLFLASYGGGLSLALYGVWIRPRRTRVRTIEVPVAGLDPAFDGYRIAQLSDLHVGSLLSKRRALRWVETANRQAADLVVCTGDYVTSGVSFHVDIADVIGGLRARDAVVAILGNHDYFGLGEPLISLLPQRGVVLLRNQRYTLVRGGATLEVAGVDDTWTGRADVERCMGGWGGASPLIALTHDPALFPDFVRHGAALVLAGHTHWGQLGVPFASERWNLARRVFRFSAGLYRDGGSTLYVNPGLGTSGPPVRLGSAPEITVFVLRAA